MLNRILTGMVLIFLVLLGLLTLRGWAFALITGIVILLGAWEWAELSGFKTFLQRFSFLIVTLIAMRISLWFPVKDILQLACIWWIVVTFILFNYPLERLRKLSKYWKGVAGLLVLVPFWTGLITLQQQHRGTLWLLMMLILVWCADTGAYFTGKFLGKHKLAPSISPGKTWEGFGGAVFATLLWLIVAMILFPSTHANLKAFILLTLATLFFSVIGDLAESVMKRVRGVKDSGVILPGHGGVMDRIDSLTAATPIFVWGALYTGILS